MFGLVVSLLVAASTDEPLRAAYRLSDPPLRMAGSMPVACEFGPDGKSLLAAGHNGPPTLWDLESGTATRVFRPEGEAGWITAAVMTPDGRTLITGNREGWVRVYETATGRLLHADQAHGEVMVRGDVEFVRNGEVTAIGVAPDGKRFATVDGGGTVKLWETATAAPLGELTFDHRRTKYRCLEFAPDGRRIWVAGDNAPVFVLDAELSESPVAIDSGPHRFIKSLVPLSDGKTAVTTGAGKVNGGMTEADVVVWDAEKKSEVPHGVPDDALGRAVAAMDGPEGPVFATLLEDAVRLSPLREGGEPVLLTSFEGPFLGAGVERDLQSASLSADGRRFAFGINGRVRCWDVTTGNELFTDTPTHSGSVVAAEVSGDGKALVTAGRDGRAILWSLAERKPLRRLGDPSWSLTDVRFLDGGRRAVVCGEDYGEGHKRTPFLREIDSESGRTVASLELPSLASVMSGTQGRLSVSGNGRRIAVPTTGRGDEFMGPAAEGLLLVGREGDSLSAGEEILPGLTVVGHRFVTGERGDDLLAFGTECLRVAPGATAPLTEAKLALPIARRTEGVVHPKGTAVFGATDVGRDRVPFAAAFGTGEAVWRGEPLEGYPTAIACDADGLRVAVAYRSQTPDAAGGVRVMRTSDGSTVATLSADAAVSALAWSPEGRTLIAGTETAAVLVFELPTSE